MKNDDRNIIALICDSLLPLAFLILVIICIVCCFTLPVHAASDQDYFPMSQNQGDLIPADHISIMEQWLDSENYYIVAYKGQQFSDGVGYFYVRYPKNSTGGIYGEKYSDLIHWSLYTIDGVSSSFSSGRLDITYSGSVYNTPFYQNPFANFTNLVSSNYDNTKAYVSNFQIYTNNNEATKKIVLLYGDQPPVIPEDDTIPEDSEKPILSDYFPEDTTPPSFDNSSVEAALGSIFNYLLYETNKISGTISGIGEYLSDSLMWGLQMVINNIRFKITEMVEAIGDKIDEVKIGIGSIIDNIEDFVDYIKEPVDKLAIETAMEGTTLYSLTTIGSSLKNTFSNYFDSIPQPDTLVFTVPYNILTKSGNVVVDFSWYANIRSSVLPWIVGFLYAGFGLAIFRSIPSIIHGVSGVLQKGG